MKIDSMICVLIFGLLVGTACTQNDIDINADNIQKEDNSSGRSSDSISHSGDGSSLDTLYIAPIPVSFDANVYDMVVESKSTPLLSPLGIGRYADIYLFAQNDREYSAHYVSKTIGTLSTFSGEPIYLYPGKYRVYAPGINTPNIHVPSFTNGIQHSLRNQVDYIWCSLPDMAVDKTAVTNELNFKHCCTQVLLCLSGAPGVTIMDFPVMQLTPSDPTGCVWNMYTGLITPATRISNAATMLPVTKANNSFYAQIIMMPLDLAGRMTTLITVSTSMDTNPVTIRVSLPVYQNQLLPGYTYQYNIILDKTGLHFTGVSLINWIAVDATNSPIIPIQL